MSMSYYLWELHERKRHLYQNATISKKEVRKIHQIEKEQRNVRRRRSRKGNEHFRRN